MKIGAFPMVARLHQAREKLIERRDQGKIGIMINGDIQDAELVERVRPAIAAVLNERIAELDEDLRQLGVDVG